MFLCLVVSENFRYTIQMVILTGKKWEIDVEPSKLTFSDNMFRQTCSSLKTVKTVTSIVTTYHPTIHQLVATRLLGGVYPTNLTGLFHVVSATVPLSNCPITKSQQGQRRSIPVGQISNIPDPRTPGTIRATRRQSGQLAKNEKTWCLSSERDSPLL